MNNRELIVWLQKLGAAAEALAELCDREAKEYGLVWHSVARSAVELADMPTKDAVRELVSDVAWLLGHRPNSFSEVYVVRADLEQQQIENVKFDALKDAVGEWTGVLRRALEAGR